MLVNALAESLDRASLASARKVFVDGFLSHPKASDVLVPRVPLSELYDHHVSAWLRKRGASIHLEASVTAITGGDVAAGLRLDDGAERFFDFVICAVPLTTRGQAAAASDANDDRSEQRVFGHPQCPDQQRSPMVRSAAHRASARGVRRAALAMGFCPKRGRQPRRALLPGRDQRLARSVLCERQSVVDEVLADLVAVFPPAASARLLRWQLITHQQAVFSVRPGLDAIRPAAKTAMPNLLLAGDWTRTGWPATMEKPRFAAVISRRKRCSNLPPEASGANSGCRFTAGTVAAGVGAGDERRGTINLAGSALAPLSNASYASSSFRRTDSVVHRTAGGGNPRARGGATRSTVIAVMTGSIIFLVQFAYRKLGMPLRVGVIRSPQLSRHGGPRRLVSQCRHASRSGRPRRARDR